MICTEVAKMYEFVKKVIAPVGAAAILAALRRMREGQEEIFPGKPGSGRCAV